jgi:hypothetical protein
MNYVENLKSDQWRKLFNIYNSSSLQCLNIFGAREDFLFEFTSLSGVWKFGNHLTGRPSMSAAHFCLTARDGRPVSRATPIPSGPTHRTENAWRRWLSVGAAPRGLAPLPLLRASLRQPSPILLCRLPRSATFHSALLHASHQEPAHSTG